MIIQNRKKGKRPYILYVVFCIIVFFLISAWYTYALLRDLPNPERLTERSIAESTKIYDRTGKILLYEVHGEEKRTVVSFSEVPESLKQATLVTEDINFYHHHGIDIKGVVRALGKIILNRKISQGGSTITQQLVKNSILTGERTFTRKIKEAILALGIETRYSKDQIFELYLNQIPYGSNAYGVAAAAETFFGKRINELSIGESALLAALPQAPTYYSPYGTHKDKLFLRREWILDRMSSFGFITKEEALQAKREVTNFVPPQNSMRAPHFVLYVQEYLNEKYGEDVIEKGGLRVTTTLDWKLQEKAEKIVKEGAEKNEKLVDAENTALVAINPKTGEIVSMVGSRDYWEEARPTHCKPGVSCKFDPFVNAVLSLRQPGSSFKPFVYATAFKKGFTTDTVLFDVETEFNPLCTNEGTPGPLIKNVKDCYHPQNYDKKFRGPVTLRQALAQSLNLPSVKLLYLAGVKDSIKTAENLGISSLKDPDRYGLSLVLGGAEVSLLEMTSSFGAFAQDGILHPKEFILRVENSKGETIEEKKDEALPVLDTNIARTINEVLSDNNARVPVFSPQSSLYFPTRQVAAKTGTTQDYRDAWVIGYTPSLVAGVWVGNNDNSPMNQAAVSIMVAGPIWHRFMDFALEDTISEEFPSPEKQKTEKPILNGVYRMEPIVRIDKISKKIATPFTPPDLIEEVGFGEIKTILVSVDKNDPTGPVPTHPENDPQLAHWQEGIDLWLAANQSTPPSPPTEYDNLHTAENIPKLDFEIINSTDTQKITIHHTSTFPLQELTIYVDEEMIGSKTGPILSQESIFPVSVEIPAGEHIIKITAYDTVGNKATIEKNIAF